MNLSFVKNVVSIVFYAVSTVSTIFVIAKKLAERSDKDK